jgi:hypothetical protein
VSEQRPVKIKEESLRVSGRRLRGSPLIFATFDDYQPFERFSFLECGLLEDEEDKRKERMKGFACKP